MYTVYDINILKTQYDNNILNREGFCTKEHWLLYNAKNQIIKVKSVNTYYRGEWNYGISSCFHWGLKRGGFVGSGDEQKTNFPSATEFIWLLYSKKEKRCDQTWMGMESETQNRERETRKRMAGIVQIQIRKIKTWPETVHKLLGTDTEVHWECHCVTILLLHCNDHRMKSTVQLNTKLDF